MNGSQLFAMLVLARVAAENPAALRLAAQLLGVAPCPNCDFVKEHCRCEKNEDRDKSLLT